MAEQQQNRFSTNSFKSQQSIEVNNELFSAPTQNAMPPASEEEEAREPEPDDIVREEDLQSEVDCSGGESHLKRNSMGSGSITRVTLNLSRQSSEQQHESIVVEETQEENVEEIGQNEPQQEVEPTIQGKAEEQEIHQAMQNSEPQKTRRPISNDSDNESVGSRPPTPYPDPDPISNDSMENEDNKIVRQPQASSRPASLLSANGQQYRHPQSMEQQQQKAVATESPNVEEKVLAQIRARNNVKNLIAKFNTATVGDETKENGSNIGGDKQKSAAENGGGAVNIKAMRQKFGQQ